MTSSYIPDIARCRTLSTLKVLLGPCHATPFISCISVCKTHLASLVANAFLQCLRALMTHAFCKHFCFWLWEANFSENAGTPTRSFWFQNHLGSTASICYIIILLMIDVLVKGALIEGMFPLICPLWLFLHFLFRRVCQCLLPTYVSGALEWKSALSDFHLLTWVGPLLHPFFSSVVLTLCPPHWGYNWKGDLWQACRTQNLIKSLAVASE